MRKILTERFVRSATAGDRPSPIFMDDEVIGFGLQVRQNGRKTFTLDYTFEGRRPRFTIGDYPACSVSQAREEAKKLKRDVNARRDPLNVRDERWAAPTIKDSVERYLESTRRRSHQTPGATRKTCWRSMCCRYGATAKSRISAPAMSMRCLPRSPRAAPANTKPSPSRSD